MENNKDKSRTGVLNKAIILLRVLEESPKDLGLTEVAKKSSINKTTCYRILQTLLTDDIVETGDLPGTYRLGIRLLRLGNVVQNRNDIRQVALPILKQLTQDTGDTSYLCILNNYRALCVERVEGHHYQMLTLKIGDSWPLYQGAAPRAILSFLDDEKINDILSEPIHKMTDKTNMSIAAYKEMVNTTRLNGFSLSDEDVVVGVASIGAPIFNHESEVVGSISLSSTKERVITKNNSSLQKNLLNSAAQISKSLGWREYKS